MKRLLIILILVLMAIISYSQDGGVRTLKTSLNKTTLRDLAGNGVSIIGVDNNGVVKKIYIDTLVFYLNGDTLKSKYNFNTQNLSGTSINWDLSKGVNLNLNLTGNTTVNMTNVTDGMAGTIHITGTTGVYTLSVSGYINNIKDEIRQSANTFILSGNKDSFSFKYNGSYLEWNGGGNYH